jgi:hypothetical protein
MRNDQAEASLLSLWLAWAFGGSLARLGAMKPNHTAEQAAAAVALSGNPSGT